MIRVLHVVSSMPRAGLENALMNYYRHIDRNEIQFDFLMAKKERGDFDDEIESLGGKIYRIPMSNPINYIKDLNKFFKKHKEYTVCHVHHIPWGALSILMAKFNGVPTRISHVHFAKSPSRALSAKSLMKWISRRFANRYFACGQVAGQNFFGEKIVEGPDFMIIKNAIDTERFRYDETVRRSLREKLGIAPDDFVIGHVARMTPVKNHKFTIDILHNLKSLKGTGKFKCIFVGDGPLRKEIEYYATEKGVAAECVFTGSVGDTQAYFQAMDYLIFPSLAEGLGLVVIEAQVAGLKCIASTGVPEESRLSDLVDFLPLEIGALKWAEFVLENGKYKRQSRLSDVKEAGYDIKSTVMELEKLYRQLSYSR